MAGIVDPSLEAKLEELIATVRAMRARNPLDDASVVNPATGGYVAMSSLVFGQVVWYWTDAQINNGDDGVVLYGAAGTFGGTGWVPAPGAGITPTLDVYVSGGRLRIDLAASLIASGKAATASLSYALIGPAASQAALGSAPIRRNGDTMRSVSISSANASGAQSSAQAGTFAFETGLPVGWYRVAARYGLTYGSDPSFIPVAQIDNPIFAVQPY